MHAIVVNLYGFYIAKIWMWTGCKRGLKQQLKPAKHKANNCQTCCECCDDLMPDWAGQVWPGLATSNILQQPKSRKLVQTLQLMADIAGQPQGLRLGQAWLMQATTMWLQLQLQAGRLTGNKWCMQICGMLQNVHILTHHSQVSHATGFCPVRFSTYFIHFLRLDAAVFCATNADRTFSFVFIIISTHHKRTFYCTQLKIKPNYGVKDCVRTQTLYCVWP